MAFVPSYSSRLYVGPLAWSLYAKGFSAQDETAMLDVTALVDTSKSFIPGQQNATATLDSMLDGSGAAGSQFITVNTWKSTPQVVTLLPQGGARGAVAEMLVGNQSQATISSNTNDVVMVSQSLQVDGGLSYGIVLDPETAITADTNGTATDNGASTSNGGVAHLHVTAFSGFTSNSVIVEHSSDNVTFTTLGTFTLATGVTSERLVISAGTTVNRYLRVRDDVTGTGSTTRTVAFARR
jgi:hypothetical protein